MTGTRWTDNPGAVAGACIVALFLYAVVVVAFRAGKRRTVAELAPFDLAAVIAVGAVMGRTATGGNSVAVGLAAIAGLMLGHGLVTRLRRYGPVRRAVDHPTAVLVLDGHVRTDALRSAGLTHGDLDATLRSQGIRSVDEVAVAVFETRSGVSVIRRGGDAPLWDGVTQTSPNASA
jgi:uncharacterized membrane protein YcaP (DUF421 family)